MTNECRLWDKVNKRMIYAEEAKESKQVLAIGLHGLPIAVDADSFKDGEIVGWNVDHVHVPMRRAGPLDVHGKKIFEGDIVKWDYKGLDYIRLVQWDNDQAMFLPNDMKGEVEIIGNIYEHPELIPV